ncbi:serine hydrolase domain-containing protein [Blautia sp. HCP3S3_G3]|uniref:serine hydrolase domain-containing protein n=1 Tax=Blautia sp. HCP3S3_G3 TaxID=3438913 RepID=UPI003F8A1954
MDLQAFVEKVNTIGVLGVKVSQHNELIGEWHSEGECRRNVYSVTKSFTSCAVGFAVQEGLLSLDEKLTDVFAEDLPENPCENLKKATVRDLLTMHLGQKSASLMGAQRPLYEEDNWVKLSLSIPFEYEPGTHFVYNNVGPYLAGMLVQRRAGCDLISYLTPRLFSHLGIKRPTWEMDPLGNSFGAGGLFLTLSEMHKLGLFYLNKGAWNGKQLLLAEWIEESTRQYAPDAPYAYLFWRGKYNSFRADGKYGQFSIVLPDYDAVISVVSECRKTEELMAAIYEEICTQL